MAYQLPDDCLNEIFEYLELDRFTLHSCLLVNHLWCEISVRILWRNTFNIKFYHKHSFKMESIESSIFSTLIACLPNESKKLLHDNKIFISTPTSKPLLFNYASFCKIISIFRINRMIDNVLKNRPSLDSKGRNSLVANEIIKMFASQISSLKKLTYYHHKFYDHDVSFPHFPGARDLLELCCSSDLPSDFFYQLSQICHNLQSISIDFYDSVTNELKELISSQNNLKNLNLSASNGSWADIIPTITKHSHTITKLNLYIDNRNSSFSFVSSFSNLQELIISSFDGVFKDFEKLLYVNFSKLQILKLPYICPETEYLMKFLENNGKNLIKFYTGGNDKAFRLSIAKFCPNLKSLFIIFNNGELEVLKNILISCQYLESIKIWCGEYYLSEKEVLEIVAKYSPNNFCELKIHHSFSISDASTDDLESFFISWERRTPKKLLSFIIIYIETSYGYSYEILEIIKKYEDLGTIEFVTKSETEEDEEEGEYYNFGF